MRNESIVKTIAASFVIAFAMAACTTVPIKPNCLRIEDTTRTHGSVCDETVSISKRSTVGGTSSGSGGSGSGGSGNPGNDKGVGGAGESPNNGGGWGNGSNGKSK